MMMIMRLNEIRRHQFLEETEKAKELYLKTITEIGLKEDPNWELEEEPLDEFKYESEYLVLGRIAEDFGDLHIAKRLFEECYRRWPDDMRSVKDLARVYRKLNLPNKSEMMYRLALSYDNDDRNTLREMSELYLELNRPLDALAWLQRALLLDPLEAENYLLVAKALKKIDKVEESIKMFRAAAILDVRRYEATLRGKITEAYAEEIGDAEELNDIYEVNEEIMEWTKKSMKYFHSRKGAREQQNARRSGE